MTFWKVLYRTTNNEQFQKLMTKLRKKYVVMIAWSKPADKDQIFMRHKIILIEKLENLR